MAIPKELQNKYEDISKILSRYCKTYLDEEYEKLCLHALEKLCQKRPSPLHRGRPNTWAAAIVYAIGRNNFIFDKSQPIHMTAQELVAPFEVSSSTAATKASLIGKLLKISYSKAEWCLPSVIAENPMLWMVTVNGMMYDARMLPAEYQKIYYEKGLIPYIYTRKK